MAQGGSKQGPRPGPYLGLHPLLSLEKGARGERERDGVTAEVRGPGLRPAGGREARPGGTKRPEPLPGPVSSRDGPRPDTGSNRRFLWTSMSSQLCDSRGGWGVKLVDWNEPFLPPALLSQESRAEQIQGQRSRKSPADTRRTARGRALRSWGPIPVLSSLQRREQGARRPDRARGTQAPGRGLPTLTQVPGRAGWGRAGRRRR